MKGQVSTELLIIVALVLLIFIPLLVLVYLKANDANQEIASYKAEIAVTRIASLANSVGSLGTSSSVDTDVLIPTNIVFLNTTGSGHGGIIVMRLNTPEGYKDIPEVLKYPLDNPGTLADESNAGGWMKIRISSVYRDNEAHVRIEKVS